MEVDINFQNIFGAGPDLRIQVYTIPGAFRSFIHTPDDWTLLADTTAVQVPEGGILIPAQAFDKISLPAQKVQSFYVAMNGAYLDSRSYGLDKTGEIDTDLGPLLIYTGAGAQSKFPEELDTTIAPKFSGVFHYSSAPASCDAQRVQTTVEYNFNVEGSVPFGYADPVAPLTESYIDDLLSSGLLVDFATNHELQRREAPYTLTNAKSSTCSDNCYSTTISVTFEHALSLAPSDLYEVLYGDLSLFSLIIGETLERAVFYSGPLLFQTTFTFVLNGVPADTTMNGRQLSYFQQQLMEFLNDNTRVGVYHVEVTDQTLPLPDSTILHIAGTISGASESSTSSVTDSLDEAVMQQGGRLPGTLLFGVLRSSTMESEDAAFFQDVSSIGWSSDPVELKDIVVPTMAPSVAPVVSPAGKVVDVAGTVGKGLDSLSDSAKDADAETWFLVGVVSAVAFFLGMVIVLLTRCHASRSMLRPTPKAKKIPSESTRSKSTWQDDSNHKQSQRLGKSGDNLDASRQGLGASPRPMRRVTRSQSMNGPLYANAGTRRSSSDSFSDLSFGPTSNSQRQPLSPDGRLGGLRSAPNRSPSRASMRSQNSWRVGPSKQQQHPLVSPQRTFSRQPVNNAPLRKNEGLPRQIARNTSLGSTAGSQRFPPALNRNGDLSFGKSSPNFRAFSPGHPGQKQRIKRQNSLSDGHPKQLHPQRQHPLVSPQRTFTPKPKLGNQNVRTKQPACPPMPSQPISRESSFGSVSIEQVGNINYPSRNIQRGTLGSSVTKGSSRSFPSPMHQHPKLNLAQASPSPMMVSSPVGKRTPGHVRPSSTSFRPTPQRSLSTKLSQPNGMARPLQSSQNGTPSPVRPSMAGPPSRSGSIGYNPSRNGALRPQVGRSTSLDLSHVPASPGKCVSQKQRHGSFSLLASNNVRPMSTMASPHHRSKQLVRSPQRQKGMPAPIGSSMAALSSRPGLMSNTANNGNFRPPIKQSLSMDLSRAPASPGKPCSQKQQHGSDYSLAADNVLPMQKMVSPRQRGKQINHSPQRQNGRPASLGPSIAAPPSRPGSIGNSANTGKFRPPVTHAFSMDLSQAPVSPGRHQSPASQRHNSSHRDPPNSARSGLFTSDKNIRPQTSIQESQRPFKSAASSQQRGSQQKRAMSTDSAGNIARRTPSSDSTTQSKDNQKTLSRRNSKESNTKSGAIQEKFAAATPLRRQQAPSEFQSDPRSRSNAPSSASPNRNRLNLESKLKPQPSTSPLQSAARK